LVVTLRFRPNSEERTFTTGVDLWAGETYGLEIQHDGTVRHGHDYDGIADAVDSGDVEP
jgi:hypothetical protein